MIETSQYPGGLVDLYGVFGSCEILGRQDFLLWVLAVQSICKGAGPILGHSGRQDYWSPDRTTFRHNREILNWFWATSCRKKELILDITVSFFTDFGQFRVNKKR